MAGALAAACSETRAIGLNDPGILSSAIRDSAEHTVDNGTTSPPAGAKVTRVTCVPNARYRFTCTVRLDNGQERSLRVMTFPGGKSYVITAGHL
jgi:hypothetical protein